MTTDTATEHQARYDERMQWAWTRCVAFNSLHSQGSIVRYFPQRGSDSGATKRVVLSTAWANGAAKACVMLEGVSECVDLDQVEVIAR